MISIDHTKEVDVSRDLFHSFIEFMKEKHGIDTEELARMIHKQDKIPVTIFNKKLSSFEAIVKYMKENFNMNYSEIAGVLHKNPGTIGVIYRNTKKKMGENFEKCPSNTVIPFSAFYPELTIFESVVYHLKHDYNLNYRKIAQLLNRNERTVWTVYQRGKKKLGWL